MFACLIFGIRFSVKTFHDLCLVYLRFFVSGGIRQFVSKVTKFLWGKFPGSQSHLETERVGRAGDGVERDGCVVGVEYAADGVAPGAKHVGVGGDG